MKCKLSPRVIIEYLLMLLIFINGQSVWIWSIGGNPFIRLACVAIALSAVLLICYRYVSRDTFFKCALIFAYLFVYLVATINTSYRVQYCVRFLLVFPLFFLIADNVWKSGRVKQFALKFADIVFVFSLISVIFYLFGTVLDALPKSVDTYEWARDIKTTVNYYHLMYEAQTSEILGVTVIRNCGIFAEAPSYAVPLILALFLELFIRERASKIRIIILMLTIITSFSSKATGIALVVAALKLCSDFYFSRKPIKGWKRILKLFLPVAILFSAAVALQIVAAKIDTDSGFMRVDNIYTGWKAFRANPLLGVGFENEDALNAYAQYLTSSGGLAMGIPVLIGEGGVYLTLFYIYGMARFIKNMQNKPLAISFVITHLLILFTSNIPYFLSTMMILAIEFATPLQKNGKNRARIF